MRKAASILLIFLALMAVRGHAPKDVGHAPIDRITAWQTALRANASTPGVPAPAESESERPAPTAAATPRPPLSRSLNKGWRPPARITS